MFLHFPEKLPGSFGNNMDTIATIIVTAFINVIITGVVSNFIFLRYQKKIESTFAKSMFEYQTKYVRNHEKMVETLETVYQRYSELRIELNNLMYDKITPIKLGEDVTVADLREAFKKSDEIFRYFEKNNIYLPQSTIVELRDVLSKTNMIYTVISLGVLILNPPKEVEYLSFSTIDFFLMLDMWNIKLEGVDEDNFDVERFFDGVIGVMKDYSKIIEKQYRIASNLS